MALVRIAPHTQLHNSVMTFVSGRSAIVFAVLAGISATLIARSFASSDHERLGYTNARSGRGSRPPLERLGGSGLDIGLCHGTVFEAADRKFGP